jgi:hypothetical protein
VKNDKKKIIEWFIEEGAISRDENLYLASRAFIANSIVGWAKRQVSVLKKEEIDYIMKTLRLFLQGKIELGWVNGNIEILAPTSEGEFQKNVQITTEGTQ